MKLYRSALVALVLTAMLTGCGGSDPVEESNDSGDPSFPCATAEVIINEGTASDELIANYFANC
jgi:hypothetical protein